MKKEEILSLIKEEKMLEVYEKVKEMYFARIEKVLRRFEKTLREFVNNLSYKKSVKKEKDEIKGYLNEIKELREITELIRDNRKGKDEIVWLNEVVDGEVEWVSWSIE